MRKVHKEAVERFMAGEPGVVGPRDRIVATRNKDIAAWEYHGSAIVKRDTGGVYVSYCGWFTPSTRDRLYAICDYLGVPRPVKTDGYIKVA